MEGSEKYPLLIGHSLAGRTRLHSVREVAAFICIHGQYDDLMIMTADGKPFLSTFGIYINWVADMEYREALLKILLPMQREIDGTAEIDEAEEETINEMEM